MNDLTCYTKLTQKLAEIIQDVYANEYWGLDEWRNIVKEVNALGNPAYPVLEIPIQSVSAVIAIDVNGDFPGVDCDDVYRMLKNSDLREHVMNLIDEEYGEVKCEVDVS
jgi:hypothetical protein